MAPVPDGVAKGVGAVASVPFALAVCVVRVRHRRGRAGGWNPLTLVPRPVVPTMVVPALLAGERDAISCDHRISRDRTLRPQRTCGRFAAAATLCVRQERGQFRLFRRRIVDWDH
jgi:hypothetical protein